ncbi:hypothetical protein FPOA_06517 [Fusarium poae]|uniref:Uncharacterized protein n=1 Tax=Fusarium poae TaxID=36050 RepID=A0A1B8AZS3_FUSPO|nr:hypothetical protein FPOA_06517 [Fusarium poae]
MSALLSVVLASPGGIGLEKRDPIVCIGCISSNGCRPPCALDGSIPGGTNGNCVCPDPNDDKGNMGCPEGCIPIGSACYDNPEDQNLCDCGTFCEGMGKTCGENKVCH